MYAEVPLRNCSLTHLACVTTTLVDAGTHHVVTNVQLDFVSYLLIETIAQLAVDDWYDDMLDHV